MLNLNQSIVVKVLGVETFCGATDAMYGRECGVAANAMLKVL